MATTLSKSPWPTIPPKGDAPPPPPKKRATPKAYAALQVEKMSLCDDPIRHNRLPTGSKYDALFAEALKTGKAIKTPGGEATPLSNVARGWLKRHNHDGITLRSVNNYGDGFGRVWFIKDETTTKKGRAS